MATWAKLLLFFPLAGLYTCAFQADLLLASLRLTFLLPLTLAKAWTIYSYRLAVVRQREASKWRGGGTVGQLSHTFGKIFGHPAKENREGKARDVYLTNLV